MIGFVIAGAVMLAILWLFARSRPAPLNRGFRGAQILSGSLMSFCTAPTTPRRPWG